jgi:hypothetical protein
MTGIGKLTLSALAGTVLLDAWLLVAMGLQSGRRAALVLVPFLAAQAAVLHVLRAPHSILWDFISSALAVGLAAPVAVAIMSTHPYLDGMDWTLWAPSFLWYMTPFFGAFLVMPPLVASVLQRARRPRR